MSELAVPYIYLLRVGRNSLKLICIWIPVAIAVEMEKLQHISVLRKGKETKGKEQKLADQMYKQKAEQSYHP